MRKKAFAVFMICILISLSFGACASQVKSEFLPAETNTELESFRELYKIGSGFYSITSQEISEFIHFLASPELEGRGNDTEGGRKAGNFLIAEMAGYFLDQYFLQDFSLSEIENPAKGDLVANYLRREGFEVRENGRNVVGILEGTGKKEEYVVVSAHYDHVGIDRIGRVYPGADDNASGTAAVLEIAEAFGMLAKEGIRPERSMIFVFFDAEEKGLWGSQYFVENPPVPFGQIAAVINLDMIGRNEPDRLGVAGYVGSSGLSQIMTKANAILKFELVWDQSLFRYSDQFSFFNASPKENPLPVIFFNSGTHKDYHEPSDTPDKVNFEKVRNVARFAFFVAWLVSNS